MSENRNLPATQSQTFPIAEIHAMAEAVAKSKLFGMKTVDECMALMLIAHAEGLHPAIAARDYHIIQGRPTLKADAMLARFQTAGGTVKWGEYTDKKVVGTFSHPQGGSVTVEWTMEMAVNAGLTKNPTWKQYPRQMLRARTVSEGIRTVFPGVVVGCYTPEEIEDTMPPTKPEKVEKVEHIEAELVKPEKKKPTAQYSEMQKKYFPRCKDALQELFGDDAEAKQRETLALSEFLGEDQIMVPGVDKYWDMDGKRLQVFCHKLEATVKAARKNAEKLPELCSECMQPVNAHSDSCPNATPPE
jgi:hypothetical protein